MTFHDDFESEFDALDQDVQDELLATAAAVERLGPRAGRPHVGKLNGSRHSNMKELRFNAGNGSQVWRAPFAFDSTQTGVILAAGDKQGKSESLFYKSLMKKADKRFDEHLTRSSKNKARR